MKVSTLAVGPSDRLLAGLRSQVAAVRLDMKPDRNSSPSIRGSRWLGLISFQAVIATFSLILRTPRPVDFSGPWFRFWNCDWATSLGLVFNGSRNAS